MKWELNKRTMQMEPAKQKGLELSARMGGIMIEDTSRNIQFLINYGNGKITHCVGCRPNNLHLFNITDARKIADYVKRVGSGRGIPQIYSDWRLYSMTNKDFNPSTENETNESEEHNDSFNNHIKIKRVDDMLNEAIDVEVE